MDEWNLFSGRSLTLIKRETECQRNCKMPRSVFYIFFSVDIYMYIYVYYVITATNCTVLVTGSRPTRGDGTINLGDGIVT